NRKKTIVVQPTSKSVRSTSPPVKGAPVMPNCRQPTSVRKKEKSTVAHGNCSWRPIRASLMGLEEMLCADSMTIYCETAKACRWSAPTSDDFCAADSHDWN